MRGMICLYRWTVAATVLIGCSLPLHAQLVGDPRCAYEEPVAENDVDCSQTSAFDAVFVDDLGAAGNAAATPHILEELRDPVFDRFVDLLLLADAWSRVDVSLMTDVALQLAEGERVLLRPRKGITATQMLKFAAHVASRKQDQASLERLAKFARHHNDPELATHIAAAQRMGGNNRHAAIRLMVPIVETDQDEFARIRDYVRRIEQASLAGEVRSLTALEVEIAADIPEFYHDAIKSMIADARARINETDPGNRQLIRVLKTLSAQSAANDVTNRLAGPTRQGAGQWWWLVEWWSPSTAQWYIDTRVYFAETQPEQLWKAEQARARNREKQLTGCGYETRIRTVFSVPTRPYLRANCPRRPEGTSGTNNSGSSGTSSSATLGTTSDTATLRAIQITNRTKYSINFRVAGRSYRLSPAQTGTYRHQNTTGRVSLGVTWPEVMSGGIGTGGGDVSAVADRHRYDFVQRNGSFYVVKVGRL